MRKNVKKQLALRVLSTAALVAMVSSIATAAFADTYDLNKGSVDILAEGGKQYITQWQDESKGTYVTDDKGENIDHRPDSDIILTTKDKTTDETKPTSNTVTIDAKEGNTANVTLQDVDIRVDTTKAKSGAIEIKGDGDTNLELNGDNTVLVENEWSEEHAAIEKADKYGKGTLTIKDDLNDDGSAKDKDENGNAAGGDTGKLLAGGYHESAAIGGGSGRDLCDTSNITITGGEITAIGGNDGGCGIGGGGRPGGTGKNICIKGNAHVTAAGAEGAAIGGGASGGNSITITDHAVVDAYGAWGSAIGDGGLYSGNGSATTITISGNSTVKAETVQSGSAIGAGQHGDSGDLTINIEENANVTAIGSYDGPAIGNRYGTDGTTTINITGGTVNAINSFGSDDPEYSYLHDGTGDHSPAIGAKIYKSEYYDGATCNVNINSSTGDTVVNAYIYGKGSGTAIGSMICTDTYNDITQRYDYVYQNVPADSANYKEDGSSHFGERNSAIVNCYNNGTVKKKELDLPSTMDPLAPGYHKYCHTITGGTLTKVVHNRKYMEENPNIDTKKLEDEDLHDWQLVGKVVEPTLEKDGYADYICSIDKCGQTKHVPLPKLTPEPSEPDVPGGNTPDTPNKPDTPKQPDGTTPAPVAPDAPVQDSTAPADTLAADTTADAAVVPADAQNVVQDAKPEAAVAASTAAVAALPQTGANWLAVVGTALSGLFLLAAGFVLDRKNRRMN
ncbi:LPXTG cell wall anchor domain-containing protein [Faecalibacterium prausnitzii]|uniref:LPXTG cell wall anchor domain-containing protein n=1 Tax=Faecalibacterium prausnitzii TaxID=853 RepID=UPI003F1D91D4